MAIYLIHRNCYALWGIDVHVTPDAETITQWCAKNWHVLYNKDDQANLTDKAAAHFGTHLYGLPFWAHDEDFNSIKLPNNDDEAFALMKDKAYNNGCVFDQNQGLSVYTDDDEVELRWWLIPQKTVDKTPDLQFFLNPELPLHAQSEGGYEPPTDVPTFELTPKGDNGGGKVWIAFSSVWDGENLGDLAGAYSVEGIQLPELMTWLAARDGNIDANIPENASWGARMRLDEVKIASRMATHPELKTLSDLFGAFRLSSPQRLCEQNSTETVLATTADALLAKAQGGDVKPVIRKGEHVIQASLPTIEDFRPNCYFRDHWIIFDDVWAAAYPNLANGVLRWAASGELPGLPKE